MPCRAAPAIIDPFPKNSGSSTRASQVGNRKKSLTKKGRQAREPENFGMVYNVEVVTHPIVHSFDVGALGEELFDDPVPAVSRRKVEKGLAILQWRKWKNCSAEKRLTVAAEAEVQH
jgi:hypothetical protein